MFFDRRLSRVKGVIYIFLSFFSGCISFPCMAINNMHSYDSDLLCHTPASSNHGQFLLCMDKTGFFVAMLKDELKPREIKVDDVRPAHL